MCIRDRAINVHSCVNAPTQLAGLEALQGPQEAVAHMAQAFEARRDLVMDRLAALPQIQVPQPKGAFYAFAEFDVAGLSAEEMQNQLLEDQGVALIAGTSFGAQARRSLRLSFANSKENIEEALERIEAWIASKG